MNLLRDDLVSPLPADYVLARLQGRRHGDKALPEGVDGWSRFDRERGWLWRRMDSTLQREFRPLFEFWELRTLLLGLRLQSGGETDPLNDLWSHSLIRPEVRAKIAEGEAVAALLPALTRLLEVEALLPQAWHEGGWAGLERSLRRAWCAGAFADRPGPVTRRLLQWLIGWLNWRARQAVQRWQLPDPPEYLPGGSLPHARLWQEESDRHLLLAVGGHLDRTALRERGAALVAAWLWRGFLRAGGGAPVEESP